MVQDNKVIGVLSVPLAGTGHGSIYISVSNLYISLKTITTRRNMKPSEKNLQKIPRRRVRYIDAIDLNEAYE